MMIKNIILTIALSVYLMANQFNIDQKIGSFALSDQFDKIYTIDNMVKTLIVSFEKDTGKDVNEFLAAQKVDFLEKNNAVFIANISGMPSIITSLFALPKMKKYKHSILLIYNENDKRFLQKSEKTTVYKIDNGVIKSINFISSKDELEKIFK